MVGSTAQEASVSGVSVLEVRSARVVAVPVVARKMVTMMPMVAKEIVLKAEAAEVEAEEVVTRMGLD